MKKATYGYINYSTPLLSGQNGFYGIVGGTPLNVYGPLTSSQTMYFYVQPTEFWELIIYISAVSGTSPSLTITIGNYTTPPITSAPYTITIQAVKGHNVKVNLNNQQTVVLPASMLSFESLGPGFGVTFNVSGTSPSFTIDHVLYFR